jgi:hypothetical protein
MVDEMKKRCEALLPVPEALSGCFDPLLVLSDIGTG